jgi:hypothetical protein
MLNRTVTVLLPSACASSLSGTNDTSLQLNGGCSTDANPNAHIVTWEWDVTCTAGTNFTVTGVNPFNLFNVNPNLLPYACPVRLRVIDSVGNTSDYVFNVNLTAAAGDDPPVANAGGPYNFCPNLTPWNLSASLSTNPGVDTITSYGWDYGDNCANNDSSNTATPYSDSTAIQPRVDTGTNNLLGFSPGAYCVKVKVTNNKGYTNVASGTVNILSANSVNCTNCVQQPAGEAKNAAPGSPGDAQLYWADTNSAALPFDHYNIYRSTDNFVTHTQIAGANGIYPAIPAPTGAKLYGGTQLVFVDGTAATAQTYYYRISPATIADQDTCSSPITVAVTVKAAR